MSGYEELIRDDVIAAVREVAGASEAQAAAVADRVLALEKVRDAFAAWWREESYSSIYDGDG